MPTLKNLQSRSRSLPIGGFLWLTVLVLAMTSCNQNHVNPGCSGTVPFNPSLQVMNGVAYTGEGNAVYALRTSDGKQLWHSVVHANTSLSTLDNGVLYVGSAFSLFALQANSGTQLWHFQGNGDPDSVFSPQPIVADGVVYVASRTSTYALRTSDGKQLWHASLGAVDKPSARTFAVGDGRVYIAGPNTLVALQASDGTQRWSFPGSVNISAASNSAVYISTGNSIYALRAKDGTPLWNLQGTTNPSASVSAPRPIVMGGMVYTNVGSAIYELRAGDGKQLWQVQSDIPYVTPIDAGQGVIYVGSGSNLTALQASNGSTLWSLNEVAGETRLVVNGIIFASRPGGGCQRAIAQLLTSRVSDGKALWNFQINP